MLFLRNQNQLIRLPTKCGISFEGLAASTCMAESLASGLRGLSLTQDRSRTPFQASSSPRCQAVELAGIDDVLDALREVTRGCLTCRVACYMGTKMRPPA